MKFVKPFLYSRKIPTALSSERGIDVKLLHCPAPLRKRIEKQPDPSYSFPELREADIITMEKKGNKIYIEPNIETIRELGDCFNTLVENFETNRELFFDEIVVS